MTENGVYKISSYCADNASYKTDQWAHKYYCDIRIADFFIALFTAMLAAVTILVVVVGWIQARHLRQSVNAARESADVLANIESPYLFVTSVQLAHLTVGPLGTYPRIDYNFGNHGKTPAVLRELCGEMHLISSLPLSPLYNPDKIARGNQVISAGLNSNIYSANLTGEFGDAEHIAFMNGERTFFIFGYAKYDDVFGRCHSFGFAFRVVHPGGDFIEDGGNAYNYRRSEKIQ